MGQAGAVGHQEFAAARVGHLYRSACLLTGGDTHLAEDLVQETLGRLYVHRGRVSRVGNPAGYPRDPRHPRADHGAAQEHRHQPAVADTPVGRPDPRIPRPRPATSG